ncbi:MAG: ABC transporter permease [Chloroflexi bacterium]|nr:ABC transporter permease [Chloroflexota bacterium]
MNNTAPQKPARVRQKGGRLLRILSLVRKETRQIIRDPSSILIAFVLPMLLMFLFGYGVSLDLNNINLGVVVEAQSAEARNLVHSFQSSRYFKVRMARDRRDLEPLLVGGRLSAVLVIPADFAERLHRRDKNPLQVLVRGTDANTGEIVLNYIEGTWRNWLVQEGINRGEARNIGIITVKPRIWFNEEVESRAALLPGSIAVIMTLIGTMLTSLVVAREWERGTMEALLATPVTRGDLMIGKFIPYFFLGMSAMGLVTAVSTLVMDIPLRGSLWLLAVVSATYLCFALGLGLLISSVTRNQFVATQAALIVGFLPSFILSGLVFELNSMPWPIRYLTYLFPPRYFVSSLRTLFLAGDVWQVIVPNTCVMAAFAAFFLTMTARKTRTRLE